jgi:hypothetical protein
VSGGVLLELARRYVWWHTPEQTLTRQDHFLCQLMQLGTAQDVRTARSLRGDDEFRAALRSALPGVLDARSWSTAAATLAAAAAMTF